MNVQHLPEGLDHSKTVLALLDAADGQQHATMGNAVFGRYLLIHRARRLIEAGGIDTIADRGRCPAEPGCNLLLPERADDEQLVGLGNRAGLPVAEPGIGKMVDVMHRPREAFYHSPLLQGGERIAGDRVLGMEEIETPVLGCFEMPDIIGDPQPHHVGDVLRGGRGHHRDRRRDRGAKQPLAGRVRRMDHRLMAEPGQRVGEFDRVHHAAARVGGMRQHRDPQPPPAGHATAPILVLAR